MKLFTVTFRGTNYNVLAVNKADAVRKLRDFLIAWHEITPRHDIRMQCTVVERPTPALAAA